MLSLVVYFSRFTTPEINTGTWLPRGGDGDARRTDWWNRNVCIQKQFVGNDVELDAHENDCDFNERCKLWKRCNKIKSRS